MPPRDPPRGLKLWTSNVTGLLKYDEYIPKGTKYYNESHSNSACVICPDMVPDWTHAADIGDSYLWSEPRWNVESQSRTFYAISGQGRCPIVPGKASIWCGWAAGREPQVLLYKSVNLVDWEFVGEFYNGTADDYSAVMTPDTFQFDTGEQAIIWLGNHNTLFVTGTADWRSSNPVFHEQSFRGNPSMGWEDTGGGTHCGQSEWDSQGRRIQFSESRTMPFFFSFLIFSFLTQHPFGSVASARES